jgi:hypothetical protein
MISFVDNPPKLDSGCSFLTLRALSLMHISSICSIYIAAISAFSLVSVLAMIGPRHSTMTATLLAIRIEIADFNVFAVSFLPFDVKINLIHEPYLLPTRGTLQK